MDLQLAFRDSYFDLALLGSDLATDAGLRAAVVISLFTDRRAEPGDILPTGSDRRGWWADAYADVSGDRIGSRLWLLGREKTLLAVAQRAEQYSKEALQWLVDDGIARSVTATAEIAGDRLSLAVVITRPDGSSLDVKFADLWEAMNV